jgi:hypothetical protein
MNLMKMDLLLSLGLVFSGAALADNHTPPTAYGQYYGIIVSDAQALMTAMTKYRESPTGQKHTSTVTLSANVANGTDRATHTISVSYPSAAAMEADFKASQDSSDRVAFSRAMREAATYETENVFARTLGRINDEQLVGAGHATMLFALTVSDPVRYSSALEVIFDSDAAASFPGNMSSGTVVAMGDVPGTHWVAFEAMDLGTLLSGVEAFMSSKDFADYSRNAAEFRKVEGRYISRSILTLRPPR